MKRRQLFLILFFSLTCFILSREAFAGGVEDLYTKREVYIPMRDSVRLHTAVYEPVGTAPGPIILIRTPYGVAPYGEGFARSLDTWMRMYVSNGYVIVFQSVRGTYLSEGVFENIRPLKPENAPWEQTDEATDTYDTVEWLLANTRSNGKVGVKGVSYPGFYAMLAGLCGHPAIKAVSPQAPVTNWWIGDDIHHNGVWMLDSYSFIASISRERKCPSEKGPSSLISIDRDIYDYFRQFPDFASLTANLGEKVPFWDEMLEHVDYDGWWQERNVAGRLYDVKPAVLVVGGSYDAEDCYGALETYRAIRSQSPGTEAFFVYGPWSHGGWNNFDYYVESVDYPFFAYYLEGKGMKPEPVRILPSRGVAGSSWCDDGADWITHEEWPVSGSGVKRMYLDRQNLSERNPVLSRSRSYVSDPLDPVPYMKHRTNKRDKAYMAADQRFAEKRADVLTYRGELLTEDLLAEGPVSVHLDVSLSTSDADFIVKVIDELPDGCQMLVRGDVFRARYRNGFTSGEAVVPGKRTSMDFTLNDIAHIFGKGHRIVVQVQSTWYPLMAVQPQFFTDPYTTDAADYKPCSVRVFNDSWVGLTIPSGK